MTDLSTLNNAELELFFNSFDVILSDIDGVLWNLLEPIPGTKDAVESLKKIGKRFIWVTNNTTKRLETFLKQFDDAGFELDPDDIVTPTHSMISFLKKQNLKNKKLFVIGMAPLKEQLVSEGFEIAENGPDRIEESLSEFAKASVTDCESVSAVIADIDVNLNYLNLQKSITFLERPEVIFLKGAEDKRFPAGFKKVLTGPGYFHDIMEDMSGRRAIAMAKPSPSLDKYIVEKYKITDKSRVLFMGDSIPIDMAHGSQNGYRKLLVLSGLATKDDLDNWTYPEEYKPNYYADSLKVIHDSILRICGKQL